jgi:glyoxylase-like metal-dependent hydrolase (beta-lactamase superfamily II)
MNNLNWEVFVTPGIPIITRDLPPGVKDAYFQAMASTLIYGTREATLVDAFMTVKQANGLADWVALRRKNLTTIYITHGHGDHWFGVGTLLERFPSARAVATPNTVKVMRKNASPEMLDWAWRPGFPGQIPDKLVIAEELGGNVIDLEGHELVAVELGHTDTDHTTCLHVPSIGLVVAGDAAYNDVHLYLAESNAQKRQEWIAALDKIESLNPLAVVASHKRPENDNNPGIIEETRRYIRDFDRLAETTRTAQELYDKMLEMYPKRVNPGWALWSSVRAVKS